MIYTVTETVPRVSDVASSSFICFGMYILINYIEKLAHFWRKKIRFYTKKCFVMDGIGE